MDRLDSVLQSLPLTRIDFIKIDVEGFEPEVLPGGESAFERFNSWLYVQITPGWFQGRGYSLELISTNLFPI